MTLMTKQIKNVGLILINSAGCFLANKTNGMSDVGHFDNERGNSEGQTGARAKKLNELMRQLLCMWERTTPCTWYSYPHSKRYLEPQ